MPAAGKGQDDACSCMLPHSASPTTRHLTPRLHLPPVCAQVKLPVTPQLYAEWHAADSSLCDHIESTAVGSGPAPARLLSHVSSWLGGVDNDCAGEAGLHARLDILIR